MTRNTNTVTCHGSRNWSPCEANIGAREAAQRCTDECDQAIRSEAAVHAVAEAKSVDEDKKIRDHADRRVNASSARRKAAASDFQQAKTADGKPRFLPIVAKSDRAIRGESKGPKLTRVAFRVSRLMEFCTKRELQNQTGHSVDDWPLVVLKEVMDNALDAAEEFEVAPVISIAVTTGSITIQDNGGGIETDTIESILDYTIRVSSREAYVSPTRGAQGNAMKTILAMGYVLDREREGEDSINDDAVGVTFIETRGVKHQIEFRVDHINNQPKLIHTTAASAIKVGTKLTINWPPKLICWNTQRTNSNSSLSLTSGLIRT